MASLATTAPAAILEAMQPQETSMSAKIDLGLTDGARTKIVAALRPVLADHYALAVKTHAFHWNVTGPNFSGLHELFSKQYEALFDAADEIAERIRALGAKADGGLATLAKASSIKEPGNNEDWKQMCLTLAADCDALVRSCRKTQGIVEDAGDAESGDLMIGRMEQLAKDAWMLRSHAE
jgi:starvation-inducible DNA-binding protein